MKPISIVAIAILALSFLSLSTRTAVASPLPDFPFVTVTGTAEKEVAPDRAVLEFSIQTFDESSEKAYQLFNQRGSEVLAILLSNKVAEDNIEAYEIDKDVRYRRNENYDVVSIMGYEFARSWSVELTDLESYEAILEALMEIDNVSNITASFNVSNREEYELELIAIATNKAKKKASQMAEGLGVTLGDVFAFNDSGSFNSFFATFGLKSDVNYERITVTGARLSKREMQQSSSSDVFIPKAIKLSKTINVLYHIHN